MSEFNGKKFYGFSLHNDPALSTNVRNFEFRYTRPEQLERAIQRVHMADETKNRPKKPAIFDKYSKVKKLSKDTQHTYTCDMDVDTLISQKEIARVRELSEEEVDLLIGKVRSRAELESAAATASTQFPHSLNTINASSGGADSQRCITPNEVDDEITVQKHHKKKAILVQEYREPQPKWVEILAPPGIALRITEDIKLPSPPVYLTSTETLQQQSEESPDALDDCMPTLHYDAMSAQAYYDVIEDSDLEIEMMRRSDYTKFCGPRPNSGELLNTSHADSETYPQFIELEQNTCVGGMSFLKNAAPIRYTDFTDEIQEDPDKQMNIYINERKQDETTDNNSDKKSAKETMKKCVKPTRNRFADKSPDKKDVLISPLIKHAKHGDGDGIDVDLYSPRFKPCRKNHTPREVSMKDNARLIYGSSIASNTERSERVKIKNAHFLKSIEDLKVEKVAIFNKMTCIQERIIELLDKLRYSLLDIYVPESSYEKSRRQKNAFEFSVRFSRNFLYPLKGMIDDLKVTTDAQLNSSSSNEACGRLASIYVLILQSLQTYQKQLRYFLLDQVPQKLTTLIEMIHLTTSISLEKGIFDKNDAIIDCLKERCTKFYGFLEDLHEERFQMARANYRKMNVNTARNTKYDLKMFMNDLNMYEPKLVPRKQKQHHSQRKSGNLSKTDSHGSTHNEHRSRSSKCQKNSRTRLYNSADMLHLQRGEESIKTQIQSNDNVGSSEMLCNSKEALTEQTSNSSNIVLEKKTEWNNSALNKAIIDALHKVTRDQVHQVMQPIIKSLGATLDMKKNSEIIETILSAFNSKLFSTIEAESEKRHDADTHEVEGRTVVTPKVSGEISTSSMRNTSKASKAAKQTNQFKQKQRQRESHEAIEVAATAAASHRGTTDDDDDDGDESEVDKNNNNSDDSNSNNSTAKHDCKITERYQRMTDPEESASVFESEDDESCRFSVILVNSKQKQLALKCDESVQQTDTLVALTSATEQNTLQKLAKQQDQERQLQKPTTTLPPPHKKHSNSTLRYPEPSKGKQRVCDRGVSISSSSMTTGSVAQRNYQTSQMRMQSNSARFNRRLFKKRRNPLLSPPPAPAATPSSSARSARKETFEEDEQLRTKTPLDRKSNVDVTLDAGTSAVKQPLIDYSTEQSPNWVAIVSESESNLSLMPTEKNMVAMEEQEQLEAEVAAIEPPIPEIPLTCNFTAAAALDDANGTKSVLNKAQCSPNITKVPNKCLVQLKPTTSENSKPNKVNSVFTKAFKDVKQKSLPLYTEESPYQSIKFAEEQLQRLKAIKNEILQQEQKQKAQQRALDELNNVADNMTQKRSQDSIAEEEDKADGNSVMQSTKLDLKVDDIIRERDQFIEMCNRNRFYSNPNYEEPWKIFTKISNKLASEIVNSVEEDFTIGVSKFVKDFLELEIKT